jgi:hypothetical protein
MHSNSYCEEWRDSRWRVVSVQSVLVKPGTFIRCLECYGAIRLHTAGPKGKPRAHAEHRIGHPGCSLGHYFNGTRKTHPSPVLPPAKTATTRGSGAVVTEDEESAFPEGKETFKLHRHLERDSALSRRIKAARLDETGKLECEVCSTDFQVKYGELGEGFIEAHHRTPVHKLDGVRKTKASELALVCSNCHRMLHRANPQLTVEELKERIRRKS